MTVRGWSTGITAAVTACWLALAAVVAWEYWQTLQDRQQISTMWSPAATEASTLAHAQAIAVAMLNQVAAATLGGSPLAAPAGPTQDPGALVEPWIDRMRRSASLLDRQLASQEAEYRMLQQALASQQRWLERAARPVIRSLGSGDSLPAARLATRQQAVDDSRVMLADSAALRDQLQGRLATQADTVTQTVNRLGLVLFMALTVVIVIIAGGVLALRRGVLRPLDAVRAHVRRAAHEAHHHHVIPGSGPVEIAAVARDAESLRRALVVEIDEARAARGALQNDAPLVDAVRAVLTGHEPSEVPGLEVFARARPTQGVIGGDFWQLIPRRDGSACLVLADVSGHGWDCGVLALQMRAVLQTWLAADACLEEAITRAWLGLASDERTIPMVLVSFEPTADRLVYVNAGHPAPVLRSTSGELIALDRTGPLVSCLGPPRGGWRSSSLPWRIGDVLIAYTDGFTETLHRDTHGVQGAPPRSPLVEAVTSVPTFFRGDVREIGELLMADMRSQIDDWVDDVTLVVVRRRA